MKTKIRCFFWGALSVCVIYTAICYFDIVAHNLSENPHYWTYNIIRVAVEDH